MLRVFDRDLYLHTESPLPDRPDGLCVVGLIVDRVDARLRRGQYVRCGQLRRNSLSPGVALT